MTRGPTQHTGLEQSILNQGKSDTGIHEQKTAAISHYKLTRASGLTAHRQYFKRGPRQICPET